MSTSVQSQMMHYLARPEEGVRRTPITGDAAWKGSEYQDRDDWVDRFTEAQLREIQQAIRIAKDTGKPTGELTREDFPLVDAPPLPVEDRELLDLYDEIAATKGMYLDMDFEPGDIQLLSNHSVLHARTAFEEYPEPERKRHLLRLWLSLPNEVSLPARLRIARSRAIAVGIFIRARVQHELWKASLVSGVRGS